MFTTGEIVGLAEWIIDDDASLVFSFVTSIRIVRECLFFLLSCSTFLNFIYVL